MAVTLEGSIKRYIGASTDTKPSVGRQFDGTTIAATELPAGSSFLERDTGIIYRWNGESWAIPPPDINETLYVLEAILAQLTQLREMVELAIGA